MNSDLNNYAYSLAHSLDSVGDLFWFGRNSNLGLLPGKVMNILDLAAPRRRRRRSLSTPTAAPPLWT